MKITIKILFTGLIMLLFAVNVSAQQSSSEDKLRRARILMSDYQDASLFRNHSDGSYDPSWEDIFRSLFRTSKIVFDVPFKVDTARTRAGMQPGVETLDAVINIYQNQVTIDQYIEAIRNAYGFYGMTNFSCLFTKTGLDTLGLGSNNKIFYGFRKTFVDTDWSVADSKNYVFEIQFDDDDQPFIASIKTVEEDQARTDVMITFVNAQRRRDEPDYLLQYVTGHFTLEFHEKVRNTNFITKTDSSGRIRPGLIPNSAILKIDTAFGKSGERFSIPAEWKQTGNKVNNQPQVGFMVPLLPWTWNGFSWSVKTFAGLIGQGSNQLTNFEAGSGFSNKTGYKYGTGVEVTKLFNLDQISSLFGDMFSATDREILKNRRSTFVGIGSGILFYNYQSRITSQNFRQNPYAYSDRLEAPVQVVVSGSSFQEVVASRGVSMPLFVEFRKILPVRMAPLHSASIQAGLNLLIPFDIKYSSEGLFSRHGYYDQLNPQPITSDPFYNYYTNAERSYSNLIAGNAVLPSWMLRFNGLFDISKGKSDNLLDVGLLFSFPYSQLIRSDPKAFYLASGNDEFSSILESRKQIYAYFIGISIGYNFINYRIY